MKQKKNNETGETFREIVRAFFRSHGIKSPSGYLAQRGGLRYGSMYFLYNQADCGVGLDRKMLDPKVACWFLQEAEGVLKENEIFEANPIEKFLRPRIEKFYKEQERIKNAAKSAK